MRIGEVIGMVTLVDCHPSLIGGCYRLAVPLTLENLAGESDEIGEELVVYDDLGTVPAAGLRSAKAARRLSRFCPKSSRLMRTMRPSWTRSS